MRRVRNPVLHTVIALLLIVVIKSPAVGDSSDSMRTIQISSLKNIPSFCVLVEDVSGLENFGIDSNSLRTMCELRCRSFGLPIKEPGGSQPCLDLNLNVIQCDGVLSGMYVYHVQLVFFQKVMVLDNRQVVTTQTWSRDFTGIAGREVVKSAVEMRIGQEVDQFINNYLSQNPRMQSTFR